MMLKLTKRNVPARRERVPAAAPPSLPRRAVLRGLGAGVALPMLQAMSPTRLLAATSTPTANPLRVGFFYVPNGMHMPDWAPGQTGRAFELTPTLQRLDRHRDHFNVLTGLALDGARPHGDGAGDHARSVAAFLTGAHPRKTDGANIFNGISVDQVIARSVGQATRFGSLELGLESSSQAGNCDSGYSCSYASNMSWRGPVHPMAKETDPRALFDRLFAGAPATSSRRPDDERRRHRQSVLDYVTEDAKRLRNHLPAEDRQKLDEYLYAVRDIEKRVTSPEPPRVNEDGVPDYPRPSGVPRQISDHSRLMMDLIALAYQTDSTRVLSFMFANASSNRPYREIGVAEGHHELSHHGRNPHKQQQIAKINRFHVDQFAYLLDRLRQIREGEGSLLDQCLLVYGSGISDGDRHNHDDLPVLIAGSGGGRTEPGRHLRYPANTPLCNLYLWMIQQAGMSETSFGDSTAPLNQLA